MRISTTTWRWLLAVVAVVGFTATAHAQRTVTLRLNTATLPDTLRPSDEVQVRGAVDGTGNFTLPDDNVIDWNDNTTLKPSNVGGDYWDLTFQIPDNAKLDYKFYSQLAEDDGIGGWEDGDNHAIEAGTGDVTQPPHYFEKGADKAYDWIPWETKADSVAVLFRVFMSTEEAVTPAVGYDRENTSQIVGVRGDPLGGEGALDWGATKVQLAPESDTKGTPGYHLFSGVAYYPESAAGTTQEYKFFVEPSGWESSDNRTFTVPAQDSTLHWVYFSNSRPATASPVESAVIFSVDLTPLETIGVFDRTRGDTLQIRGAFNGWDCDNPDDCILFPVPGEPVYEQLIPITAFPESEQAYKFFLEINDEAFMDQFGVDVVPSGWEEPISTTGANRVFVFEGNETGFQDLGEQRFNDIYPGNILPAGASVDLHFEVDMGPATSAAEPFVPASDSVTIQVEDPIWMFSQGLLTDEQFRPIPDAMLMTDANGDMVYEGTLTINGPTYAAIQYKYAFGGEGRWVVEPGAGTGTIGRRRTRFIEPNADGSFPASWQVESETYQPESGALPFDQNPLTVGVEEVASEVPTRITLDQNYPNPFNPSTQILYTIDQTQHVRVKVYDLMGRVVATLVDGVQPAATYRITFDGADLASGVYVYQLETPMRTISKKMVLVK